MKTKSLTQFLAPTGRTYLYRHSSTGFYYAVKRLRGQIVRHPLGTSDPASAKRQLIFWLSQCASAATAAGPSTFEALLTSFLASRAGKSKSTRTAERNLANKLRATFDQPPAGRGMGIQVEKIKHSHLAAWLAKLPVMRHSTFDRHRLFLMQLCDFLSMETGLESPFRPAKLPARGAQSVVRHVPTQAEFAALIEDIRRPRWPQANARTRGGQRPLYQPDSADFAEYLGLAGVGQAEAAALRWEDVDWGQGLVRYTRKKTGKAFTHPIYPWLRPLLERLRAESAKKGESGRVLRFQEVGSSLASAVKRLGFANFTQRSLRGGLIGRLWKSGVDVKLIAKWQGHSDGGVLIMRIYTEVFGSNDKSYEQAELAKVAWGNVVPFAKAS
jgi:integrase